MIYAALKRGGTMRSLIVILLCFLLTGCLGTKKTTEKSQTTTQKEQSSEVKESTKETNTNRAINENFGISLKTGDSLVNARIRQALRDFKYSNSSGANSTELRFDEESMALLIANIIGETKDEKELTNNSLVVQKTFEQTTDEYIKTKISQIPWWGYVIVGLLVVPKLIEGFGFFTNPLLKLIRKKDESN